MGGGLQEAKKYTLRLFDGMDGVWCDIASGGLKKLLPIWAERTANGTKATRYADIDYYCIFTADTKMLYSGNFTMRGED